VEPVMLGLLLLGLIVPLLSGLIDKEIGVRRKDPRGRIAATAALIGIVLMWGMRDYEHRRAVNALAARTYNDVDPLRVSAYPKMTDPFHWSGVVETPSFFALAPVNSLEPEVDPAGRMEIRYKPQETPITIAAKKSYAGRAFLDWAKYPITETETLEDSPGGFIVHFQDLRYADVSSTDNDRGRSVLGAAVMLDQNLHVIGDVYGSEGKQVVVPDRGLR
jgi:inner membrane protein